MTAGKKKQLTSTLSSEFPRVGSLFNYEHEKWKDHEFVPAFDEDSDPVVDGYK